MARPYSVDLRRRVLAYIEETADKTKASQLFNVGIAKIVGGKSPREAYAI